MHWNGIGWITVPSPNPGGVTSAYDQNALNGVSADSPTDAWAVGTYTTPSTAGKSDFLENGLLLHWNGVNWTQTAFPNPCTTPGGPQCGLSAVSAISPTDAWAVGDEMTNAPSFNTGVPLILHWNGISWTMYATSTPGGLSGVSTVSSGTA